VNKDEDGKILGMNTSEFLRTVVAILVAMSGTYLAVEKKIDANINGLEQNKKVVSELREDQREYIKVSIELEKRIDRNGVKLNEINKSVDEIKEEIKFSRRRRGRK